MVYYDSVEKVHKLNIQFKIPVIFHPEGGDKETNVIVNPPKSGRKPRNQNEPVRDYSTVVDRSPTTPKTGYSLHLCVELKYANLWTSSYTPYQHELFNLICDYHDGQGWNFKQISDFFVDNNYITPRGKTFTHSLVWSMYSKKNKSIQRFSRKYNHVIVDMKVAVMD